MNPAYISLVRVLYSSARGHKSLRTCVCYRNFFFQRSYTSDRQTFLDQILDEEEKEILLHSFNTDSLEELEEITNITRTRANNIIKQRKKVEQFHSMSDILRIPGFQALFVTQILTDWRLKKQQIEKSKEEEVKARCTPAVVSDVQVCTK